LESAPAKGDVAAQLATAQPPQALTQPPVPPAALLRPEKLAWSRVSYKHVKHVDWTAVVACETYLLLYARC